MPTQSPPHQAPPPPGQPNSDWRAPGNHGSPAPGTDRRKLLGW